MEKLSSDLEKLSKEERIEEIRSFLLYRGVIWCIAALIEGSIGYYQYKSALIVIREFLQGLTDERFLVSFRERSYACFGTDLTLEMLHDFRLFLYIEQEHPEKTANVVQYTEKSAELSSEAQWSLSMLYPTHM